MSDALKTFVPLFAFMLIPVWIPLITAAVGRLADLLGGHRRDEVAARIEAVKERSEARRASRSELGAPDIAR